MQRYPRDDDWGDWAHEQRRDRELARRLDEQPACVRCGKPARPYSDHCTPCLRSLREHEGSN